LGGIGVIFSSPAAAQPFPTFPFHPITVGNTYVVNTTTDPSRPGGCSSTPEGECSFRQAVAQYDSDTGVAPSPYLHVINQDQITFSSTPTNGGPSVVQGGDPVYNIDNGPVIFDNANGVSATATGNGQRVTQIDGG